MRYNEIVLNYSLMCKLLYVHIMIYYELKKSLYMRFSVCVGY